MKWSQHRETWCEMRVGIMMVSWDKTILDLKGCCLYSKSIECPSEEFKSRKKHLKWRDVSLETISLVLGWRTDWKWRPSLSFSISRNTLVFGFATLKSSPLVHFVVVVDCFEDVCLSQYCLLNV